MSEPAANIDARRASSGRREQILAIASRLFAERGIRNTTVRDIADAAGMLSGSLYYHFDSKESMVDEIMRPFQDLLSVQYEAVMGDGRPATERLGDILRLTFQAIHDHQEAVAIYQNEIAILGDVPRFAYLRERNEKSRAIWTSILADGVADGELRADLDIDLAFKVLRDSVWSAVRWYNPSGDMTHSEIADQYVYMLLDGMRANPRAKQATPARRASTKR